MSSGSGAGVMMYRLDGSNVIVLLYTYRTRVCNFYFQYKAARIWTFEQHVVICKSRKRVSSHLRSVRRCTRDYLRWIFSVVIKTSKQVRRYTHDNLKDDSSEWFAWRAQVHVDYVFVLLVHPRLVALPLLR